MANYNVNWSSEGETPSVPGKTEILVAQKAIDDTSTSITLTGKGLPNYGEIQQENFIHLMENFASQFPPSNPTIGQLWYNTLESILYLRVDPDLVTDQPKYYAQSPAAWVQVWPHATTAAGLYEYSLLASHINRVIGTPTTYGTNADPALNHYGWGQTDLVPLYWDKSTLAPGFSSTVYPAAFDNNSWVILLARLRKALRHIDVDVEGLEGLVSPVGFISDGRPIDGGNALSNQFNDNPVATNLADYSAGFGQTGILGLQLNYVQTLAAVDTLVTKRFRRAAISTVTNKILGVTRTSPWTSTITHQQSITFASADAAAAYFNSGGALQFKWYHTPTTADAINTSWQSFLASQTNMIWDYTGFRRGDTYEPVLNGVTEQTTGFFDLTSTPTPILRRERGGHLYQAPAVITDGGIEISTWVTTGTGGVLELHFNVSFVEGAAVGETIQGTTISEVWGLKASGLNVNSPILAQPVGASAGTFGS